MKSELKTWFVSWDTGIDFQSEPLNRCALRGPYNYLEAIAEMRRIHADGLAASCVQISQSARLAMGVRS